MLRDTVVTTMLQLSLRDTDAWNHLREIFFNIVCSAVNNNQIFNKNVRTKDTRNKMKRIKSKFLNTEHFVRYFENDTQPLFWCMISKEIIKQTTITTILTIFGQTITRIWIVRANTNENSYSFQLELLKIVRTPWPRWNSKFFFDIVKKESLSEWNKRVNKTSIIWLVV